MIGQMKRMFSEQVEKDRQIGQLQSVGGRALGDNKLGVNRKARRMLEARRRRSEKHK